MAKSLAGSGIRRIFTIPSQSLKLFLLSCATSQTCEIRRVVRVFAESGDTAAPKSVTGL